MSTYLGWDELQDEWETSSVATSEPNRDSLRDATPPEVREKLAALMEERVKLEKRLLKLIGKSEPDEEDRRREALYPMPIHTAESRLLDRKAAKEEQRARALARRVMERTRIEAREENARIEEKREAERRILQAEAYERAEQRRAQERHEDWLRILRLQESMRSRWAEQRELALQKQKQTRSRLRIQFEQRNEERRTEALQRLFQKHQIEQALYTRLDRRAQRAKLVAKESAEIEARLEKRRRNASRKINEAKTEYARLDRRARRKDDIEDER